MKTLLISLLFITSALKAESLVLGERYKIAEPDALIELEEKVKTTAWPETPEQGLAEKIHQLQAKLPVADKNETYTFRPSFAVPFDVTLPNGKVLVKKGTLLYPLDRVRLPNRLILINQNQAVWAKNQLKPGDQVLLNQGDHQKTSKILQEPVFILDKATAKRLEATKVPSIIEQVGNQLKIQVFDWQTKQQEVSHG